jgi:glycosyltransferase involved in cell wall biosynthesis
LTAALIFKNKALRNITTQAKKGDVFYFFWGKETAEVLPLINTTGIKVYVRMHGYDLYKERSRGYIPYRNQLLKKTDKVLLISKHGYDYLHKEFSVPKNRMVINRLGTKAIVPARFSADNTLRIMSCSAVISLKRVELLARAIKLLRIPVIWTHIGTGPLLDVVKKETEVVPSNAKINLAGHVNPSDIQMYYSNKEIDLFINVSTREGVSVAIMEAIAAGIPIMATNVGGTPEIVTEDSGVLVPRDIDPETLSQKIEEYAKLPIDKKIILKNGALKIFEENYNSEKNAIALADILVS